MQRIDRPTSKLSTVPAQAGPARDPSGRVLISPGFVAVVAVDGSEASIRALVWAMETARVTKWSLDVLTIWPVHAPVFVHGSPGYSEPRWRAAALQSSAITAALSRVENHPSFSKRLENGHVLKSLVEVAASASLLVLGTDEVSVGVVPPPDAKPAAHTPRLTVDVRRMAACPVVVVPVELRASATKGPVTVA